MADAKDRLICPICWAAGDCTDVIEGRARLERGTRIEGRLRVLVDRARFPKSPAPATPPGPDGEAADMATAAQGDTKAAPERS